MSDVLSLFGGIIAPPARPSPVRRIVSSRPRILTQKVGGTPNNYQRELGRMVCPVGVAGARDMVAYYGNFYQGAGELVDVATITIRSSIDITSPLIQNRPSLWNGQRSLTLAPGDVGSFELGGYVAAPRSNVMVRTELTVANAGDQWPGGNGNDLSALGENFLINYDTTTNNIYNTGALVTGGGGGVTLGFGPLALVGTPVDPNASRSAVLALGDSIMDGTGDTRDTTGNRGYMRCLTAKGIPVLQQARPSDQVANYAGGFRKKAMWRFCTHAISNFDTNGIAGGQTAAAIKASLTAEWADLKSYGLHVTQVLMTPRCTDAAGTVPLAGFQAIRSDVNAWIISQVGKGSLDMAIDPTPAIESTSLPGTWADPSYTVDGLHYTQAGYNRVLPAFAPWVSQL